MVCMPLAMLGGLVVASMGPRPPKPKAAPLLPEIISVHGDNVLVRDRHTGEIRWVTEPLEKSTP